MQPSSTAITSTASSSAGLSLSSPLSAPSVLAPPSVTPNEPGLRGPQKAGIAVGVIIGALLILSIIGFLLWRRRKIQKTASPSSPRQESQAIAELPALQATPELPGSAGPARMFEKAQPKPELPGSEAAVELRADETQQDRNR